MCRYVGPHGLQIHRVGAFLWISHLGDLPASGIRPGRLLDQRCRLQGREVAPQGGNQIKRRPQGLLGRRIRDLPDVGVASYDCTSCAILIP